ncbi:hypothetical protein GCM10029992_18850 [Glycomyces albus]
MSVLSTSKNAAEGPCACSMSSGLKGWTITLWRSTSGPWASGSDGLGTQEALMEASISDTLKAYRSKTDTL